MKRVTLPVFLDQLDLDAVRAIYEAAAATRGEIPCARHVHPMTGGVCDDPPAAHETCDRCWSWRDCDDPACDHPACGHGGVWYRFRAAYLERWPDVDVLVERSPPMPLIELGRMRVLVDEERADEAMARRILEALSRQREWRQLYDLRLGTDATTWLSGEVWLAQTGQPVEASVARYQHGSSIAEQLAAGADPASIVGGSTVHEFRLLVAVELDDAPELTQGALF